MRLEQVENIVLKKMEDARTERDWEGVNRTIADYHRLGYDVSTYKLLSKRLRKMGVEKWNANIKTLGLLIGEEVTL